MNRPWIAAIALSTALFIGLSAQSVQAEIYSYTDADGVVHFTNLRPKQSSKWKKVAWSTPDAGTKAAAQRGDCPRCDKVRSNDNSPDRFARYDTYIAEASALFHIPQELIRAVIHVESDYDTAVVSAMDAKGLMQLMPSVIEDMGVRADHVFEPRENIMGGTRLLRTLANRYDGDLTLTIAAYHAGPGSLAKYGNNVPPYQYTQQYLKMVLARYQEYKTKAAK